MDCVLRSASSMQSPVSPQQLCRGHPGLFTLYIWQGEAARIFALVLIKARVWVMSVCVGLNLKEKTGAFFCLLFPPLAQHLIRQPKH